MIQGIIALRSFFLLFEHTTLGSILLISATICRTQALLMVAVATSNLNLVQEYSTLG